MVFVVIFFFGGGQIWGELPPARCGYVPVNNTNSWPLAYSKGHTEELQNMFFVL